MSLTTVVVAGERPPRGADGGRSRLRRQPELTVLAAGNQAEVGKRRVDPMGADAVRCSSHRGCCATVRYLPATIVVGSYGVTTRSADSRPLSSESLTGPERLVHPPLRLPRSPTSSSAASCARLETPSLA